MEAQRGQVTCLSSHSWAARNPGFESRWKPPKLLLLSVVTLPLEGVKVGKYIRIAFYLASSWLLGQPSVLAGRGQGGWPLPIKRLVFLLKGEI